MYLLGTTIIVYKSELTTDNAAPAQSLQSINTPLIISDQLILLLKADEPYHYPFHKPMRLETVQLTNFSCS